VSSARHKPTRLHAVIGKQNEEARLSELDRIGIEMPRQCGIEIRIEDVLAGTHDSQFFCQILGGDGSPTRATRVEPATSSGDFDGNSAESGRSSFCDSDCLTGKIKNPVKGLLRLRLRHRFASVHRTVSLEQNPFGALDRIYRQTLLRG
jgi:hypothetical protein